MPITGPEPGCLEADELGTGCDRPTVLVSAVALIDVDGRVLITKRPEGKAMAGLWEFPGGKVEVGETPEAALIRELREELAIDITRSCLAPLTFASHSYNDFHLLMPLYACTTWEGEPQGAEGQQLAWATAPELSRYDMPPADAPLLPAIRRAMEDSVRASWDTWATVEQCTTAAKVGCLFNVFDDPSERHDLALLQPQLAATLLHRLRELDATLFDPPRGAPGRGAPPRSQPTRSQPADARWAAVSSRTERRPWRRPPATGAHRRPIAVTS